MRTALADVAAFIAVFVAVVAVAALVIGVCILLGVAAARCAQLLVEATS